jgi:hypothetical protein
VQKKYMRNISQSGERAERAMASRLENQEQLIFRIDLMMYPGSICPKYCIKVQPTTVPKLRHDFQLPTCLYAKRIRTLQPWRFVQINTVMFLEKKTASVFSSTRIWTETASFLCFSYNSWALFLARLYTSEGRMKVSLVDSTPRAAAFMTLSLCFAMICTSENPSRRQF